MDDAELARTFVAAVTGILHDNEKGVRRAIGELLDARPAAEVVAMAADICAATLSSFKISDSDWNRFTTEMIAYLGQKDQRRHRHHHM